VTRRVICGLVLAATAAVGTPLMTSTAAGAAVPEASAAAPAADLDGFAISWLPPGLGTASDFSYEWDGVQFRSRVWESGPDSSGGYHEDLAVDVLRGEALASAPQLYAWLKDYEDRAQWRFVPFVFRGRPGYLGADEAFWLVRPGVAVMMRINRDEYGLGQLLRVADGIRPV
jgi:hypothetical protein